MKGNEVAENLRDSLILRYIRENSWGQFMNAVEIERERSAKLLTYEACIHIVIHEYFSEVK